MHLQAGLLLVFRACRGCGIFASCSFQNLEEGSQEVGTTTVAVKNPFASRNPRPALEDLLDLVNERDQIRFARLDNSLLEGGAFRELYYYGTSWGWAVRYRHGRQTLMTVHFLPGHIEVTRPNVAGRLEEDAQGTAGAEPHQVVPGPHEDQCGCHGADACRRSKDRRGRAAARWRLRHRVVGLFGPAIRRAFFWGRNDRPCLSWS